MVLKHLG